MIDVRMDPAAGADKKGSQKTRGITETWAARELYCPFCGCSRLNKFENNKPVADLYCPRCGAEFELKSRKKRMDAKISGGAYGKMIERLRAENSPHFLMLEYDPGWVVRNLWLVPRYFVTETLIERRSPLRASARRRGWVGCYILWRKIPEEQRVPLILGNAECGPDSVQAALREMGFMVGDMRRRSGWQADVLACIGRLPDDTFVLADAYAFEEELARLHPNNRHVKDKIRQMLQVLRDQGLIEFLGDGMYRKTHIDL